MPYQRILGAAARERRLKREREFKELMEWTKNRPRPYTGRTGSHDDEVRRRWCSFFGFDFKKMAPRPLYPFHRGRRDVDPSENEDEPDTEESSSGSSNATTGSSDNAIMEPDTWATDKGPGRSMVQDESNYIVTAEQYVYAFHLDGRVDSTSSFWSQQMGSYFEVWQSAGLLLEDAEFREVLDHITVTNYTNLHIYLTRIFDFSVNLFA